MSTGSMQGLRGVGQTGEDLAAAWLLEQGVEIIERNFQWKGGELDLIGRQDGAWLFVEVKYRRSRRNGWPAAAVTRSKQKMVIRSANVWLKDHGGTQQRIRFDVLSLYQPHLDHPPVIQWYRGAFRPEGYA